MWTPPELINQAAQILAVSPNETALVQHRAHHALCRAFVR